MPDRPGPRRPLADLPSLFRPVALREGADALARAAALAPTHGAGTLCWVGAYARAEAAVVLEPEMPLAPARLAFHAAAGALADALASLGPPEVPAGLRWPGTVLLDGAACGALGLATPPGAAEDAVPEWLAVGFELRLAFPEGHEPGLLPGQTSLREQGFDPGLGAAAVTEAWARHLMAGLDEWQARGAQRVAERYLSWLADRAEAPGVRRGVDPATGDLILERDGRARERRALRDALRAAAEVPA